MQEFKWLEDRVETLAGGAYKFGSVGELEIGRIQEELTIRGEAFGILMEAQLAFAEGRVGYEGASQQLPQLVRARFELRAQLEEVFGWIDLCFEGRAPIAELPEKQKLPFAIESLGHLRRWQRKPKAAAQVAAPEPKEVAARA